MITTKQIKYNLTLIVKGGQIPTDILLVVHSMYPIYITLLYFLMKCDMLLIRYDIYYTPVLFSVSGIWDLV